MHLCSGMEEAVEEVKAHRSTQFDPNVLDPFLQLVASGELSGCLASAAGVQ
jgi:response regulator RpfG family c-di-GMP phosphodiesterase